MRTHFSIKICRAAKLALFLLCNAAAITACFESDSSSEFAPEGGGSSTTTIILPPNTTTTTLSCRQSVVDMGKKGIVTGTSRGAYSDLKMVPETSYVATAYVDASNLAIKLSYQNADGWNSEIIAGDGTGAFIRLVFIPTTGIPVVFWTLGTNLKVAIRSAPLSTTGTWSAGVIDTGTAPRAVEAAANPLGQIGLVYLTGVTPATDRPKFVFCDTGCASFTDFRTMSPNPYLDNSNTLSQSVVGFAWCKNTSTQYYPAVSYSIAGPATRYAICQNTLENCRSNTNWVTQAVVAAGNGISKLHIDPNNSSDVPKVVRYNGSNLTTYKMGALPCNGAPGAFTAGTTFGAATLGNQWLQLLGDSSGKFHIVANEGTTAMRYFNSTSTDINAAWNTVGNIETTTLPAATVGGADIDPLSNGVFASYATNVAPFTLKFARITDYSLNSNVTTFSKAEPDLTGSMQLVTANSQFRNISMASTTSGRPAAAVVDYSAGPTGTPRLKYALRMGSSASDSWMIIEIPEVQNPMYPSLAFDHNNKPWILYFDSTLVRFILITNSIMDGSGTWSRYEVPYTPSGAAAALPAANNTALAMLNSGGVANPVAIFIDTNAGSRGLKSALLTTSTHKWSSVTTIDALGASGASHVSTDYDANGNVVLSYYDRTLTRAKYSYSTNGTSWSAPYLVTLAGEGTGVNIKINPATSKPAIAYYIKASNAIYYSPCSGTIASCASSGWAPAVVYSGAGVSTLPDTVDQILNAALFFNSSGTAHIVFPSGSLGMGSLMVATNLSGSFLTSVLSSGANATLSGSPLFNFALSGLGVSLTLNSSGSFTALHVGPGNWLYSNSCGD